MSSHSCFWMEPTEEVEIHLRRYAGGYGSNCCSMSGLGYHNKWLAVERGHVHSYPTVYGDVWPHNDPRWPTGCDCGYLFQPTDHWQFCPVDLYRRPDTGQLLTQHSAPPGAMLDAAWRADFTGYRVGADGILLDVKLPDGTWWCVDGPTTDEHGVKGGGWQRTGVIPHVSATPSIVIGNRSRPSYHGFLTNGVLNSTSDSPC